MVDGSTQMEAGPLLWARRGLVLALTALAAWLIVRLILLLLSPSSAWTPVALATPTATQATARTAYDFSTNPFSAGNDAVDESPVIAPGADAPETTLNLNLTGTRTGPNGSAFITTPDGQNDAYYEGDEIQNRVVLRGIGTDHVLIEVNGQMQRLTLDDVKNAARDTANTPRAATLTTLKVPDAQTLLNQIALTPALDATGTRIGVAVATRSSAVRLEDYGLRNGDIITSFAGQSLTSGFPDIAALRRVAQRGRPVPVQIIRDGTPMTLTIGGPA